MENIYKLKEIIKNLTLTIKKQDFLVYFRKMSIVEIKNNKIIFWVESGFMKNNLEAKFRKEILEATQKQDSNIEDIEFVVDDKIDNPTNSQVVDCTKYYKELSKTSKTSKKAPKEEWPTTNKRNINSRYTLDKFVVGPDSQLAHSACVAVSKKPGKSYNPLYIMVMYDYEKLTYFKQQVIKF